MIIELEVVDTGNGTLTVLMPEWRAKLAEKMMREQAGQAQDPETRASLDAAADAVVTYQREIREKVASHIEKRTFEAKPYKYGGKKEARRLATHWENGQPRFDEDEYQARIVACSLGKPYEEVLGFDAPVVYSLFAEISERFEPDPGKLDFLLSSPTASVQTPIRP